MQHSSPARARVAGKFLWAGDEKLYLRGLTYGTFDGTDELPIPDVVSADFKAIAATGANVVRAYTVPPRWLLDLAGEHGLRVLVGIPWEQHITFLDSRRRQRSIETQISTAVQQCAGHKAVLGYVVGNEIPPGIVRWHGRQRIERFIERLYRAAKAEEPTAIVTYANYPSTEYLDLPFLDVVCFNLFLEEPTEFESYLARLHTIAADRPLIIGELGLDSRRHGLKAQAQSLATQVAVAFRAGCAGCVVFSWTDDWTRAGHQVIDWDFGMVDRARRPKPAIAALRTSFARVPLGDGRRWPRVSVVVCSHNGARSIGRCIDALQDLDYPDYETIVIDDGSTDATGQIAVARGARVIQTENNGLSAARNAGTAAADGEVIAFCDDDCQPDRHWLRYLVATLLDGGFDGVGGPNLPPPSTVVADSVGHAPGGPTHVLLTPTVAEHIPGCNMAFRRTSLQEIGGFDPQFRSAGDDVDVCWRMQEVGEGLGFSPAAVVWHQPRTSVIGYVRQQIGYGRAEALLERKWPERYNGSGHLDWDGTLYGGRARRSYARRRWHVYYGRSGGALFQSVYSRRGGASTFFPLAPEWYLAVVALVSVLALGFVANPLVPDIPLIGVSPSLVLLLACLLIMGTRAGIWSLALILPTSMRRRRRMAIRTLTFCLCLLQPLARLWGRTRQGLTPWRVRGAHVYAVPRARVVSVWSENWMDAETWTDRLQQGLARRVAQVVRGGGYDTWDLQLSLGPLAAARVRLAVEEHGEGRQLVRLRIWPHWSPIGIASEALLVALTALAVARDETAPAIGLALATVWLAGRMAFQAAGSVIAPVEVAATLDAASDAAQRVSAQQPALRERLQEGT
jgi:glycosyltransferase involved in cell wall biosynthesis